MSRRITSLVVALLVFVAVAWAQSEKNAQALTPQDYMEIEQLYAKYYHSIDAGDPDSWAAVFTPDGAFNTMKGTEALKRFIQNGTAKGTPLRHWQSNLLLTPVEGGVQAKVYVMQYDIRQKPITPVSFSRYDDFLVKTRDGWRFKEKIRSSDTTIGNPNAGASPRQP